MEKWIMYGILAAFLLAMRDYFTTNHTKKYTTTEHLLYYYVFCAISISTYVCYRKFSNKEKYLVFSGIGNHQTFISMLKKFGLNILKDLEFSDHYQYTKKDLDKVLNEAKELNCKIISTEKDYVRINYEKINQIKFIKSELKIANEEKLIQSLI